MEGTNTLEELIAETNEANAVKAEKQKRAQEAAQKAREAKEAQQAAGGRPHFTPPFAGRSDSAVPPPPPAWEEEIRVLGAGGQRQRAAGEPPAPGGVTRSIPIEKQPGAPKRGSGLSLGRENK